MSIGCVLCWLGSAVAVLMKNLWGILGKGDRLLRPLRVTVDPICHSRTTEICSL